ncbi:hypothetical protein GE061_007702 [Apolygus lucorum]|uniref:DNA/RNA non-specific endonuclease/pyrophosphatase/phosphodiesterase domain-containing protein n=1 Tax=Apolygus lucorum TaxID=248454 RepID=A0A8S9WP30_APOLU|nr:hypothetical protein GE061_007702 [Apolygus lucorum]
MTRLWRLVFYYQLITKIAVHCRIVPDEYCQDIKPECDGSPLCQESKVGSEKITGWTCKATEVEIVALEDDEEEMESKPGNFEIDVRSSLAVKNPPVLLIMDERGEWKLAEPTRRTKLKVFMNLKDEKILLACPGKSNYIQGPGLPRVQTIEASSTYTNGETQFVIEDRLYQPDSINCSKRVSAYEFMTESACNDDGVLLRLGFYINNKVMELMRTCHRLVDGLTYYSRHVLDGSHFPARGRGGHGKVAAGRPQFGHFNKALFRNFPPKKFYTQKSQNQLRLIDDVEPNGNGRKYFSKGHLAPKADFMLAPWEDATFLFVNTQPQWQEINGGSWMKIESEIRFNAAETTKKYEVITGVAGHLNLNGAKVYLDVSHRRLPVPNRFTKLVREIETNKCMAFVVNNYPQRNNLEPECRDVCSSYNWPELKEPADGGYLYCCAYEDFIEAFPEASPEVDCSGGELSNANRYGGWQRYS